MAAKIFDKNKAGVSQLIQSPNTWAIDLWRKGCANHWMPQEVDMSTDIKQWKNNGFITEDEKLLVKRTLGLFAMGESMVSNSIDTVEYRYITDGACRQYLLRKNFEESLHNWTVAVCCEAYGLNVDEVAEAYKNIPTIKKKNNFVASRLEKFDFDFDIDTKEGKQKFLKNMATFYLVMEGTWFFSNFALIMSLGRQNKLTGLYDQINYTIRDESIHVEFGVGVINKIKEDYPSVWSKQLQEEICVIVEEGVNIEIEYAKDILPNGILGVTSDMLVSYIKYLANSRLEAVGLPLLYENTQNPFPWLGEAQDATGIAAFFERREKNYQNAGMLDDDF
jgi:ribonucleoside-diphosphate reductase beta chain